MRNRGRPRLYLDIDGVINADAPMWGDTVVVQVTENYGAGYKVRHKVTYSPILVAAIDSLRVEFDVELVILSTWLENAAIFQMQKKLNAFRGSRWLNIPARGGRQQELPDMWKVDQLIGDLGDDPGPFIWVDDDEVPEHRQFVSNMTDLPSLLIAPNSAHGLTQQHLAAMQEFLAACRT